MKKNNGAISIFALIAMMFFLIFVMAVYNNLSTKSQTQIETTGVLVDLYGSDENARTIYTQYLNGGSSENVKPQYFKSSAEEDKMSELTDEEYIFINGKIYKRKPRKIIKI